MGLDGYKAATHWATFDVLDVLGVESVRERVVVDRNRISGGGVPAGIDFGLRALTELRGDVVANTTQLMLEFDPKPPFDAGSPGSAGPEVTGVVQGMLRRDMEEPSMAVAWAVMQRRLATADA